ncbi:hypothetical protein [Zongyangia hominis]|uniref:Uncharacterized protein n=1 Tax=Zongyangia hominis TaxID=2763677 RepID=A0A926IB64_9FIRM|nr:hypothetical protein [Zongyangia hominis]MBC8569852.1 hypothetical protein [Zongyangia hominis]
MKIEWKLDQRMAFILLGLLLIVAGLLCYPKEGGQDRENPAQPGVESESVYAAGETPSGAKMGFLLGE